VSYTEVLNKVLNYSNKTTNQISAESKKYEKSISSAYISQLKNGKKPPATEEVNLTIAKICGYPDPEELVFEAYIESAPDIMQKFIENLIGFFEKIFSKSFINGLPKNEAEILKKQFHNKDLRYSILKTFLDKKLINALFKSLKNPIPVNYKKQKMLIPNFGAFIIEDDSMSPTISKGDKMEINSTLKVGIGDIGIFKIKDQKKSITRRLFEEGEKYLLVPENKNNNNILRCNPEDVEIIGKVTAVIKEIHSTKPDKIINMS
jgi:hypothetical protein